MSSLWRFARAGSRAPQGATTTLVSSEVRRPRRPQGSFEAEVSLRIYRSTLNREGAGVRAGSGNPRPQSQPFYISLLVCRSLCKALPLLINLPEKAKSAFFCALQQITKNPARWPGFNKLSLKGPFNGSPDYFLEP